MARPLPEEWTIKVSKKGARDFMARHDGHPESSGWGPTPEDAVARLRLLLLQSH